MTIMSRKFRDWPVVVCATAGFAFTQSYIALLPLVVSLVSVCLKDTCARCLKRSDEHNAELLYTRTREVSGATVPFLRRDDTIKSLHASLHNASSSSLRNLPKSPLEMPHRICWGVAYVILDMGTRTKIVAYVECGRRL
jgi:hypothetical protein